MKRLLAFFAVSFVFLISQVAGVLASDIDAFIDRANDRIFSTPADSATFNLNVTVRNIGGTAVKGINITLPLGIRISSLDSSTDVGINTNSCRNITGFDANIQNGAGQGQCIVSGTGNTVDVVLGDQIAAGGVRWFRLGVDGASGTIYSNATSGVKNFTIQATDTSEVLSTTNIFILTLNSGAIGFDIRNTTNFPNTPTARRNSAVLPNALVNLILLTTTANSNSSIKTDTNSTGLLFWTSSEVTGLLSSPTVFSYAISYGIHPVRIPKANLTYTAGSVEKDDVDVPILLYGQGVGNTTLNVEVLDELSNKQWGSNVSVYVAPSCNSGALLATNITSSNYANWVNFSVSPGATSAQYWVRAEKLGYARTNCTQVNLLDGSFTNISFSGTSAPVNVPVGTNTTVRGMNYTVRVYAQDQLGTGLTLSAATTSFAGYSTLTSAGFTSSILPQFSGDVAYLNLTGSGQLEVNRTGFVRTNTTNAVSPQPAFSTNVTYISGGTGEGLPFTVRIATLQDEATTVLTQAAGDNITVTLNGPAATSTNLIRGPTLSGGNYYIALANNSLYRIQYGKVGYILNNASTEATYNSQTNVTYQNASGTSSGLLTVLKIRVQDELSQDLFTTTRPDSNITFTMNMTINRTGGNIAEQLNLTWTANATTFGYAYMAFSTVEYGTFFARVDKVGYLPLNTSTQTISNTSQTVVTVNLPFSARISRVEDWMTAPLTQLSTDSISIINSTFVPPSLVTSNISTPINTTFSGGIWYLALDPSYKYNITYNKTGYLVANASGVSPVALHPQRNITFINGTNPLNFSLIVYVKDELGNDLGMDGSNTTFQGFTNVSQINFSSNRFIAYIPAAQNISAQLRINITGFISQNTSGALQLSSLVNNQTFVNYSYAASGSGAAPGPLNGTGLNYTWKIDQVQDERGNVLTQASADTVTVFSPGGATRYSPLAGSPRLFGGQWRVAVAENTNYIVGYGQTVFIDKNDTNSANRDTVTLVNWTGPTNGLNFTLRIDVYDQFNNSDAMDSNISFTVNRTQAKEGDVGILTLIPNATSRNSYYFSINPATNPWNISVWRLGFVARNSSTDRGLSNFSISNVTQTLINLTGATGCNQAGHGGGVAIGNGTFICGGLNYSLEVSAQDELGTVLTLASGQTTFLPNTTDAPANALTMNITILRFSGGKAYIAANSSGTGELLEINHTGYIRQNTTNAVLALRSHAQQSITFQSSGTGAALNFPLRVGVQDASGSPLNATVTVKDHNSANQFVYDRHNSTVGGHGTYYFPLNFSLYDKVNVTVASAGYTTVVVPDPSTQQVSTSVTNTLQARVNVTLSRAALGAPTLADPGDNEFTSDTTPTLTWSNVTVARMYEIQIDNNSDFSSITQSSNQTANDTSGTSYTAAALTAGVYFWRVRAYDAINNTGDFAASRRLTIDNTNPSTPAIASPSNNTNVTGTVTINVSAEDNSGGAGISRVELIKNQTVFANITASPYQYDWVTSLELDGTYVIEARAVDKAGNAVNSSTLLVRVINARSVSVEITTPANNTFQSDTITIAATASAVAGINRVEFYRDTGTRIATDVTPPYSTTLDTTGLTDGYHTLIAGVFDNNATPVTVNSTTITIRVDNTAPTISITTVANKVVNRTQGGSVDVNITYTEANPDTAVIQLVQGIVVFTSVTLDENAVTGGTNVAKNISIAVPGSIAEGLYGIVANITDKANRTASSQNLDIVRIDNTRPTATIENPAASSTTTSRNPWINATLADSGGAGIDPSTIVIKLNGTSQTVTFDGGRSVAYVRPALASDGTFTVTVDVSDFSGLTATQTGWQFIIDSTAPTANITSPLSGEVTGANATFITLTNEAATCQYVLNGGAYTAFTATGSTTHSSTLTSLSAGVNRLGVNCTDTAGNAGASVNISWTVDTTGPQTSVTLVNGTATHVDHGTVSTNRDWVIINASATQGSALSNINTAEYFLFKPGELQTIPTSGTGTSMAATDGAFNTLTENIGVNISSLDQQGTYTVKIHAQNALNTWGGFTTVQFYRDSNNPVIRITAPANQTNTSATTPLVTFYVTDTVGGSGIDANSIAVNVSGFNANTDCSGIASGSFNISCSFRPTLAASRNHTLVFALKDRAGNNATNGTLMIGVDTTKGINLTFNGTRSKLTAVADGTHASSISATSGGWIFEFNVSTGTGGNATRFKMADWCKVGSACSGNDVIPVSTNVVMNYTAPNGTTYSYGVRNDYNETEVIVPLQDFNTASAGVQSSITVHVKVPTTVNSGSYATTYAAGLYSVAISGG